MKCFVTECKKEASMDLRYVSLGQPVDRNHMEAFEYDPLGPFCFSFCLSHVSVLTQTVESPTYDPTTNYKMGEPGPRTFDGNPLARVKETYPRVEIPREQLNKLDVYKPL